MRNVAPLSSSAGNMAFANVNIDGKNTYLAELIWDEDVCNVTLLDYQGLKTWKAQVYWQTFDL